MLNARYKDVLREKEGVEVEEAGALSYTLIVSKACPTTKSSSRTTSQHGLPSHEQGYVRNVRNYQPLM